MESLALLQEFVSAYGPPGQEHEVRSLVQAEFGRLGIESIVDAKGNVMASGRGPVRVLVTAHMDEIAMIVRQVLPDGSLVVGSLGGLYPWKTGEGPVAILTSVGEVPGVLSFGSIHTEDARANVSVARKEPVTWSMARVHTGLSRHEVEAAGIRPGCRVVIHRSRRTLLPLGPLVSGYFLDDRADLVAMFLALEALGGIPDGVTFAATASEEVGGEGALYMMNQWQPEVCIALELSPNVPDAPVQISPSPALWVTDSYGTMQADDIALVERAAHRSRTELQYQALSLGGSDASCAAGKGLCARPITLGIPMENSHGYEIMHGEAMDGLARLLIGVLQELGG